MAKKSFRTTFGGKTLPDRRTKTEILRALDKTTDALSAAIDSRTKLAKDGTKLHARIQDLEAIEDHLKAKLNAMKQQRNQLLDAIEDFQEADHEAKVEKQNRNVAYARMADLHSEIGTERSNEMVQPLHFEHSKTHGWRQNKGAGI